MSIKSISAATTLPYPPIAAKRSAQHQIDPKQSADKAPHSQKLPLVAVPGKAVSESVRAENEQRRQVEVEQTVKQPLEKTPGKVALTPDGKALAAKIAQSQSNSIPQQLPEVEDSATQVDSGTAADGDSPPENGWWLTIDGLLAAWGQTDSPYDLNGDGVVDVSDLLALLAAGGTMPGPGEGPPPPLTIDGLMQAWGTNNPHYDLNGDGVVDVSDLLMLLAQLRQGNDSTPEEPAMLTVDGLMAAWGPGDSIYDLNGDGVVDVSDLLALLAAGGTMPMPNQNPEPELTIDGLLAAWGTNNPMYDLTGSGVVDVSDLLALLNMLNGQSNA